MRRRSFLRMAVASLLAPLATPSQQPRDSEASWEQHDEWVKRVFKNGANPHGVIKFKQEYECAFNVADENAMFSREDVEKAAKLVQEHTEKRIFDGGSHVGFDPEDVEGFGRVRGLQSNSVVFDDIFPEEPLPYRWFSEPSFAMLDNRRILLGSL